MTQDESAFLKAISDNPADETARSVYADWLADRDDPRAAFARLSADFLRCVRGLADLRRAIPTEWLEVMDPLFNRFGVHFFGGDGSGNQGTVTAVQIAPGSPVTEGQPVVLTRSGPTVVQEVAESSGIVTAVLVRQGETISVGQPLFTLFSGIEKFALRTPRAPMLEFIQSLEKQRTTLRQNPKELNEAMLARHATALQMVFGTKAIHEARSDAWRELGWDPRADMEATRKQRGITDEEWVQVRIDVHIKSLHLLLARHGQPDSIPPVTE